MKNTYSDLKTVYSALGDNLSKNYFFECIKVSLEHTGQESGMGLNYLKYHPKYPEFVEDMTKAAEILKQRQNEGKKICFYPVTPSTPSFIQLFADYGVKIECQSDIDSSLHGKTMYGLSVISPDELIRDQDKYVVIMVGMTSDKLVKWLMDSGIREDGICDAFYRMRHWLLPDGYYFNHSFFTPINNEIYVDVGAYDGAETIAFRDYTNDSYKKIYVFEPEPRNLKRVENALTGFRDTVFLPKCAYSSETNVEFFSVSANPGESFIYENDKYKFYYVPNAGTVTTVPAVKIDDVVGNEKVTFLRMDIEGGELQALIGAEKTIRENKPRMAVCIYHKPDDIFTIPQYILSLREDYKFYIRHHAFSDGDLVMYCV